MPPLPGVSPAPTTRLGPAANPAPGSLDNAAVRNWTRNQVIDVKYHGRIPAELVVTFKTAQ
jgi:hypothetical protein